MDFPNNTISDPAQVAKKLDEIARLAASINAEAAKTFLKGVPVTSPEYPVYKEIVDVVFHIDEYPA